MENEGASSPMTRAEWMNSFLIEWQRRLSELPPAELARIRADLTGALSDALWKSVEQSLGPMPEK
jgi:hypothetical protein